MTESEAINFLKNNEERNPASRYIRVKQLSISALEKQIPKKAEIEKYTKRELYFCPICGTEVTDCKYCPQCGQKIELGE